MRSVRVHFSLGQEAWSRYALEAEQQGLKLGTYLRRRLERWELAVAEMSLRIVVRNSAAPATPPESALAEFPGALVEVLLLLRSLAGPRNTAMVQKEVERRGLTSWK